MIVFTLTSLSGTGLRSTARRAMLDPSQCTSRQGKLELVILTLYYPYLLSMSLTSAKKRKISINLHRPANERYVHTMKVLIPVLRIRKSLVKKRAIEADVLPLNYSRPVNSILQRAAVMTVY